MRKELEAIIEQAKRVEYYYHQQDILFNDDEQMSLSVKQVQDMEIEFAKQQKKLEEMKEEFLSKYNSLT